jgi:hypothetical protein
MVPGYVSPSSNLATMPAPPPGAPLGTPNGTPAAPLPATGANIVDPGYLQAMAAYNRGGAPAMTPAARDQARGVVELPPPPRSSGGLGILLLILVCAAAATGGYFVVHYLTTP